MGLSGLFGKRNIGRVEVSLRMPEEAYAGTPAPVTVSVRSGRAVMPVFLIRVIVGEAETLIPFVPAGGSASGTLMVTFPRRGRHRIESVRISSVFPFNFFTRFRTVPAKEGLIVFPALKPCPASLFLAEDDRNRGERERDRVGFEGEALSVREYRYGDPRKYIHWKASAKTGRLKTKELSSLVRQPPVIDLDRVGIMDLEERLSCVAGFIVKSFKNATPVVLKVGGRIIGRREGGQGGRASRVEMLRELALYGGE